MSSSLAGKSALKQDGTRQEPWARQEKGCCHDCTIGEADGDGSPGEPVLRAGGLDEVRQDHGTRGDVGFVDRSISQAMEEREPAIEGDAATNREDR